MDIPRIFNVMESAHRIHNPFTPEKLATLGAALRLEKGTRILDLGSGSGEMLCTWAASNSRNILQEKHYIDLLRPFVKVVWSCLQKSNNNQIN